MLKVPPFTVVVDQREQREYPMIGIAKVKGLLKTGDYSIVGLEHRIAIERKSKPDLWGCVAKDRERFEKCLQRLSELEFGAVVIECSLDEFAIPPVQVKRVTTATAVGSALSWMVQYRIPFVWTPNRVFAERVVLRMLASFVKHKGGLQ